MTNLASGGVVRIGSNFVLDWLAGFEKYLSGPSLSEIYIRLYQDVL
jgi:hypothetical protein